MNVSDYLLRELENEAAITRRLLERVPSSKLSWKPHEKSMSLGQLAQHIAYTPGAIASSSVPDSYPVENFKPEPAPASTDEILKAHDSSVAEAKSVLAALDEGKAQASWCMTAEGQPMLTMPRIEWIRTYLLNHWSSSRSTVGIPARAQRARARNLWAQRGRESIRVNSPPGYFLRFFGTNVKNRRGLSTKSPAAFPRSTRPPAVSDRTRSPFSHTPRPRCAIGKAHGETNLPIFTHTGIPGRSALGQLDISGEGRGKTGARCDRALGEPGGS